MAKLLPVCSFVPFSEPKLVILIFLIVLMIYFQLSADISEENYDKRKLTTFELSEIKEYSKIYFVGPHAKKRIDFDDKDGVYKVVLHDHLAYRFEIIKYIGKGSFGHVVRAFDHKDKQVTFLLSKRMTLFTIPRKVSFN
ncbi:unnamed protein product [Meloidogyne enterolobii]|uniref:Uncharacterized protein n=1 Tax=Meloidogyne enterolobii TaxID=390850 RepID=A0ACB0Z496_MELEN